MAVAAGDSEGWRRRSARHQANESELLDCCCADSSAVARVWGRGDGARLEQRQRRRFAGRRHIVVASGPSVLSTST